MFSPSLLGPPELNNSKPQPLTTTPSSDTFIDLMVSNFNKTQVHFPMGYTENHSATYLTSGNPCLDFFFHVVPDTPPQSLIQRLSSAWAHDSFTTLKLVFNLRGVRGTGKSDKEGFYTASFWLHQHHPKTLACNLSSLADFGYIKDMPEILYRLLEGPDVRKIQANEWNRRKPLSKYKRRKYRSFKIHQRRLRKKELKQRRSSIPKEDRVENVMAEKKKARKERSERRIAKAKKVLERYTRDPDFRFLYERVSDFFADSLKADMELLASGKQRQISLAAKWCPSIDSSFDRSLLLCESIARKVFPRESYQEYGGIEEAHYAYRVRDRLRKEVLVPLRKALQLPEVYISANRWDILPYNRVASVAMNFYKDRFLKYDNERFSKYLEDVKSGKATIAAGALLPHQIIQCLRRGDYDDQVSELQWKRMVDDLLKTGKLQNCMAVSDVSGSMRGIPMDVSVALGVLVSELSDDPWRGKLITFSRDPKLQMITGHTLSEKTEFVKQMDWGANTDFQKVFDVILKVAVEGKLREDQMIKRLFVFSDMEFDQASARPWETDYEVIVQKFIAAGYGNVIPELVFWNLRDSKSTPVPGTQKGTALVSGFSKNMIKLFMNDDGSLNPLTVMEMSISGEEYQKLVVFD